MIEFDGKFLPDGETHIQKWMSTTNQRVDGKLAYQWRKQERAYALAKSRKLAIDVGAHVGLWSMHMTRAFDRVAAFEPISSHRECFLRNVVQTNVELFPYALGDAPGEVRLTVSEFSSGDSHISEDGDHRSEIRTLDSFGFLDVGLIKIDTEGYELFVVRGAEQTIRRDRPVIVVEQKPNKAATFGLNETGAVELLISWGARIDSEFAGDYFMVWE